MALYSCASNSMYIHSADKAPAPAPVMPKIMPLTTAWLISHARFVGWVGFGSSSQSLPGQVPTSICAAEGGFGHPEKPLRVGQVVNHGPMGQPHSIYGCKLLNVSVLQKPRAEYTQDLSMGFPA